MPATFKPVLKKEPKKDGTHLVMVRITAMRKSTYLSAGIYIKKSDWNEKGSYEKSNWIRTTCTMHAVYNQALKDKIKDAETKLFEAEKKGSVSSKSIKQKIKIGNTDNFTDYFSNLNKKNQTLSNRTIERNEGTINKLIAFKGKEIFFHDLNHTFLKDFEAFLLKSGLSINTTAKHLEIVAGAIKSAVKDEHIDYLQNPFLKFKIRHEKTSIERLTYSEIQLIANAEIDIKKKMYHSRNIFMLQFYCAGVRISDMLMMRFSNIQENRLVYVMSKTDKPKSVLLMPEALKIIELYRNSESKSTDYIFPFMDNSSDYSDIKYFNAQIESKTAQINGLLKDLAKSLGIEKNISTHKARHSFAEYARKKNIDIYTISKALSHSSIKITESYLARFDEGAVDSALETMFK